MARVARRLGTPADSDPVVRTFRRKMSAKAGEPGPAAYDSAGVTRAGRGLRGAVSRPFTTLRRGLSRAGQSGSNE